MKNHKAFLRCGVIALAALATAPSFGQQPGVATGVGIPHDWSHHHLVFSQPASVSDALGLERDPRYWHQRYYRKARAQNAGVSSSDIRSNRLPVHPPVREPVLSRIQGDWSEDLGSTASLGAGNYPAVYSFYPGNASCSSDFVVFSTGLPGGASQPSIIAYNNLYSGCAGSTDPSVYWQYNTAYSQGSGADDGSKIVTSVALSSLGDQVAFIQSNSSNVASLVILRWAGNSSLVSLSSGANNVAPANYYNCAAPCMTRIPLHGSPNDTNSSPFYDYFNDLLYVGDDSGVLHKFQHVFNSTSANPPGEITGGGTSSGWPVTISGNKLTSPVFDGGPSQKLFVGDSGGFLYSEPAGGGSGNLVRSLQVGVGPGIVDGPLVDSSQETVYVFVGQDMNGSNPNSPCSAGKSQVCNGVYQFPVNFTASTGLAESVLGVSTSSTIIHDGTFDNAYYSSPSSGNIYVCGSGNSGGSGVGPKLLNIPVSNFKSGPSSFDATSDVGSLTSGAAGCSPVSEIDDGITDWIFLSVTAGGNQTGCTGACLYNFNVTNEPPSAVNAGFSAAGGTSGIIINNAAAPRTLQIYYSTLGSQSCTGGTGGCAVQASQEAR